MVMPSVRSRRLDGYTRLADAARVKAAIRERRIIADLVAEDQTTGMLHTCPREYAIATLEMVLRKGRDLLHEWRQDGSVQRVAAIYRAGHRIGLDRKQASIAFGLAIADERGLFVPPDHGDAFTIHEALMTIGLNPDAGIPALRLDGGHRAAAREDER